MTITADNTRNCTLADRQSWPAPAPAPILTGAGPGWDDARRAWNLAADQHPATIAVPEPADDIAAGLEQAPAGQDWQDVALQLRLLLSSGTSLAIATVVGAHGTVLRRPGTVLVVTEAGQTIGFNPARPLDGAIRDLAAAETLATGRDRLQRLRIEQDAAGYIGLSGEISLDVHAMRVDAADSAYRRHAALSRQRGRGSADHRHLRRGRICRYRSRPRRRPAGPLRPAAGGHPGRPVPAGLPPHRTQNLRPRRRERRHRPPRLDGVLPTGMSPASTSPAGRPRSRQRTPQQQATTSGSATAAPPWREPQPQARPRIRPAERGQDGLGNLNVLMAARDPAHQPDPRAFSAQHVRVISNHHAPFEPHNPCSALC
jgi:XdhC and CoxI family